MGYSQEAQTFKDIHEDSLSSDSMSEEFPLLVASLPSRTEIHSEEIHTSCEEDTVQRQDDEYPASFQEVKKSKACTKKVHTKQQQEQSVLLLSKRGLWLVP